MRSRIGTSPLLQTCSEAKRSPDGVKSALDSCRQVRKASQLGIGRETIAGSMVLHAKIVLPVRGLRLFAETRIRRGRRSSSTWA